MMARLCLNAIVKNEAARIERMLASVAPHIACWAIVDTGSTDGTQTAIRRFFSDRGIPGWLDEQPFVDFSTTRNVALDYARRMLAIRSPRADYLLLMDADMELVVEDLAWADELAAPAYRMIQKTVELSYWNLRLLRIGTRAKYQGSTHEYLSVDGDTINLNGAYFIDHADGSNRSGKFERDLKLLQDEIAPTARAWFYYAQSMKDLGNLRGAADAYAVRASLGGWSEEVFYAKLMQARCVRDLGDL